ncbi:MAG TPA: hypothetical protein VF771_20605 [Longimicrobiaceae bacterium]
MRPAAAALLILLSLLLNRPVQAQARARADTIRGVVLDSATAAPIRGAAIRSRRGQGTVTDSAGRFELPVGRGTEDTLGIGRIGYEQVRYPVGGVRAEVVIRLQPDPVMLQALAAVGRSSPVRGRTIWSGGEGGEAWREFDAHGPVQFVEDVLGWRRTACPGVPAPDRRMPYCTLLRGTPQAIRLYVDEVPASGGLDDLALYAPYEIYSIEVDRARGVVWVSTNYYMRVLAGRHLRHNQR